MPLRGKPRRNNTTNCPYADLPRSFKILAADEWCDRKQATVCALDSTCSIISNSLLTDDAIEFLGFDAVGNMTLYPHDILSIGETNKIDITFLELPSTMRELYFSNITKLDISTIKAPLPDDLHSITFLTCQLEVFPPEFIWPKNLTSIWLQANKLQTIPKYLPKTLTEVAVQDNFLSDFSYLPKGITFLNLYNNYIEEAVNMDFSSLYFLALGGEPNLSFFETMAYVKFSKNLTFFSCKECPITNVTLDRTSYNALDALEQFGGDENKLSGFEMTRGFSVNSTRCRDIGGQVMPLWANKSNMTFQVCVVKDSSQDSSIRKNNSGLDMTSMILVCSLALALVGLVAVLMWRRRVLGDVSEDKEKSNEDLPDESKEINVTELRPHKLELSDLSIVSKYPMGSGHSSEFWLGQYAGEKVVIKRLKSKHAADVSQFMDEILLLSKIECEYIIKFIGVSWRRPIDMECVVEFMDQGDLRTYLVNHSPSTFPWEAKKKCLEGIVGGLVYLHSMDPPVVHRDLKSRNVLLDSKKGTKLSDFGVSREIIEVELTNAIGTYQWMAPEVISGTEYDTSADIYSLGVLISELTTHAIPYSDMKNSTTGKYLSRQNIMARVAAGQLLPTFDETTSPPWVKEIALKCLTLSPTERLTAMQVQMLLRKAAT